VFLRLVRRAHRNTSPAAQEMGRRWKKGTDWERWWRTDKGGGRTCAIPSSNGQGQRPPFHKLGFSGDDYGSQEP